MKEKRLSARLDELNSLNRNIGRLTFFIQEHEVDEEEESLNLFKQQLEAMVTYRDVLQQRIIRGFY